MARRRSTCLSLRGDSEGDDDVDGDGYGMGDRDVLARLVKPKGEHMKPSYKFRWDRGDQYAYRWGANQETKTAMAMATGTVRSETETEMATETYCHIWSSQKVS